MPRPSRLLLGLLTLALACDDPSGPPDGDPYGFAIVHDGDELFAWNPATHTAADSVVLPAGDSIAVELHFYDEYGDRVVPAGAELFVLPGHFDLFRWVPSDSEAFRGSFVTVSADTTSVIRIQVTRGEEILLSTGYVGVRIEP